MTHKVGESTVKAAGNRGKGRPKGSKNKTTTLAKAAIATAAEKLGGTDRLVAWAQEAPENERAFWTTIYPKLLPLQGPGDNGEHLIAHQISLIGRKAE